MVQCSPSAPMTRAPAVIVQVLDRDKVQPSDSMASALVWVGIHPDLACPVGHRQPW